MNRRYRSANADTDGDRARKKVNAAESRNGGASLVAGVGSPAFLTEEV
jgi:hypothetical protein